MLHYDGAQIGWSMAKIKPDDEDAVTNFRPIGAIDNEEARTILKEKEHSEMNNSEIAAVHSISADTLKKYEKPALSR
jgi:hypothetical protein